MNEPLEPGTFVIAQTPSGKSWGYIRNFDKSNRWYLVRESTQEHGFRGQYFRRPKAILNVIRDGDIPVEVVSYLRQGLNNE